LNIYINIIYFTFFLYFYTNFILLLECSSPNTTLEQSTTRENQIGKSKGDG